MKPDVTFPGYQDVPEGRYVADIFQGLFVHRRKRLDLWYQHPASFPDGSAMAAGWPLMEAK